MIKRYSSGFVGVGILAVTVYFSFVVARGMYFSYILWPKEKAGEHYILPTRWQDLTFLSIFWATSIVLLFVSFRLIRFAVKGRRLSKQEKLPA